MQIQFLVVVQVPEREKYPEICASSKPISFTTNRTDNLFWMNEINTTGMEKIKTTLPKHNHLESGKHDSPEPQSDFFPSGMGKKEVEIES